MDDSKHFYRYEHWSGRLVSVLQKHMFDDAVSWLRKRGVIIREVGSDMDTTKIQIFFRADEVQRLTDEDRVEFVLRFC